jgi:hypothetical protein
MLFVWLVSFGIGVANACLVQPDQRSGEYFSQGRSGTRFAELPERRVAPDHFVAHSSHSDEIASPPGKIACLHFCVAEQSTLPTDQLVGLVHLDLVPILFLTGLLVPVIEQMSLPEAIASPTWLEPPVSIRYLRLTI